MSSRTRQLDRLKAIPAPHLQRTTSWRQAGKVAYWIGVGWWASWLWIQGIWLANALWGFDAACKMANRLPLFLLLGGPTHEKQHDPIQTLPSERQHPWPLRVAYFVLIGWWLSWIWANLAWGLSITILGLPLGLLALSYLPTVATLLRAD